MTLQTGPPRRRIAGERKRRTTRHEPDQHSESHGSEKPTHPETSQSGADREGGFPSRVAVARGVPGWLLIGLAVLLVAVIAFDVIITVRHQHRDDVADTRSSGITSAFNTAPAKAERAAEQVLSYDYKTLSQHAEKVQSSMTSDYATQYQKTVKKLLAAPAKQVKAHVVARVKSSGVISATPSKVTVLMFVDQTSKTTHNTKPQTALNRVVFTMVKNSGRWLVDDVTSL
ncbi:MAG: hypothetical protein ACRDQA_10210 [Nocardioidaceae bacterium]